jgi:Na+/H+-dicarboxylate symporter
MWQIDDLIHYGILLAFYIAIGLAALFGRKARKYFMLNYSLRAVLFLLLAFAFYTLVYFLLYKLCHGFNFWFYFSAVLIAVGLVTHFFLPIKRISDTEE